MKPASSMVENGVMETANRNRMCIHERRRSERLKWFSCVCWPTQKIPSVMKAPSSLGGKVLHQIHHVPPAQRRSEQRRCRCIVRPINQQRLADDIGPRYEPPVAAVG